MTNDEKIFQELSKRIFNCLPCRIEKINGSNSFADVVPVIFDGIALPVIPSVPILTLGNASGGIKFRFKVGDVLYVSFSQLDWSKYLAVGMSGQVESKTPFALASAVALPIRVFTKNDSVSNASVDIEMFGDVKISGNVEITESVNIGGNINANGDINASGDIEGLEVIASYIKLSNHAHGVVALGSATEETFPAV